MSISVLGVGHVVLNVRDLERSVAFYARVLGMREVGRLDDKMAFFSATGENHHDLALNEVGPQALPPNEQAVGLCHFALKIGDSLECLRAARDHLERNGVLIRRIEDHRVSKSIYFADPDGNEIEVYFDEDPRIWREDPAAVANAETFEL